MEDASDDVTMEDDEFVHVEECPSCASQEVHEILSEKEIGGGADYRVRCETCSHVHLIQVRPPKAISVQFTLSDGAHSISKAIEVDEDGNPLETREDMRTRLETIVPRLLSKYDKNKDGTIDIHELGHLLKDMNGLNRFPPRTHIASVMQDLDVDGNGHVTTDEFVKWYVVVLFDTFTL